jgi:hypothetical protein
MDGVFAESMEAPRGRISAGAGRLSHPGRVWGKNVPRSDLCLIARSRRTDLIGRSGT